MRTGVIKDVDLSGLPAPHEEEGFTSNVPAHEAARLGDFRLVAQVEPAFLENLLLLEFEDLRRCHRRAMVSKEPLLGFIDDQIFDIQSSLRDHGFSSVRNSNVWYE